MRVPDDPDGGGNADLTGLPTDPPAATTAPAPPGGDPFAALPSAPAALIVRVARLASDLLAEALAPLGLRPRHYAVLAALAEHGPTSQQHLGRLVAIDRTTMVGVVDDLERQGLVVRAANPADRRANRVELTGRGRTGLVRATGAAARAERRLVAGLSHEEEAQLVALLRRLVEPAGAGPDRA